MIRVRWVAILLSLTFWGCASNTVSLSNVDEPAAIIFRSIEASMPMGVAERLDQGKTVISKPFKVKQEANKDDEGFFKERGVAKVFVLGLDRPYRIEVEVEIQRAYFEPGKSKDSSEKNLSYEKNRMDKRLAQQLLSVIQDHIYNREKNRNVIDDFRPF